MHEALEIIRQNPGWALKEALGLVFVLALIALFVWGLLGAWIPDTQALRGRDGAAVRR